jgi:hypothetical protein
VWRTLQCVLTSNCGHIKPKGFRDLLLAGFWGYCLARIGWSSPCSKGVQRLVQNTTLSFVCEHDSLLAAAVDACMPRWRGTTWLACWCCCYFCLQCFCESIECIACVCQLATAPAATASRQRASTKFTAYQEALCMCVYGSQVCARPAYCVHDADCVALAFIGCA